jgi:hypothetical protein
MDVLRTHFLSRKVLPPGVERRVELPAPLPEKGENLKLAGRSKERSPGFNDPCLLLGDLD